MPPRALMQGENAMPRVLCGAMELFGMLQLATGHTASIACLFQLSAVSRLADIGYACCRCAIHHPRVEEFSPSPLLVSFLRTPPRDLSPAALGPHNRFHRKFVIFHEIYRKYIIDFRLLVRIVWKAARRGTIARRRAKTGETTLI